MFEDTSVTLDLHFEAGFGFELLARYRIADSRGRTLIELNEREYDDMQSLQQVLAALADVAPESPVILDIAPDVPVGDWVRVLDISKAAGFESISFATEGEPGE